MAAPSSASPGTRIPRRAGPACSRRWISPASSPTCALHCGLVAWHEQPDASFQLVREEEELRRHVAGDETRRAGADPGGRSGWAASSAEDAEHDTVTATNPATKAMVALAVGVPVTALIPLLRWLYDWQGAVGVHHPRHRSGVSFRRLDRPPRQYGAHGVVPARRGAAVRAGVLEHPAIPRRPLVLARRRSPDVPVGRGGSMKPRTRRSRSPAACPAILRFLRPGKKAAHRPGAGRRRGARHGAPRRAEGAGGDAHSGRLRRRHQHGRAGRRRVRPGCRWTR